MQDVIHKGSRNFDLRIIELQDDVGEKSSHLVDRFGATSLWDTVDRMGYVVLAIEEESDTSSGIQEKDIKNY